MVEYIPLFNYKVFIHPRWLGMGFLNQLSKNDEGGEQSRAQHGIGGSITILKK